MCGKSKTEMEMRLQEPRVWMRYAYALKQIEWKLRWIDVELAEQKNRQIIRAMNGRLKSVDSIKKKLRRKGKPVTFESAEANLNDIAGMRVVCYFCDDIDIVADAIRKQRDLRIVKEKDYVRNPKPSGYQSVHIIVAVPLTCGAVTEEIPVEIQIRSVAMDYWAELDTQMCYKKSAGQIKHVEREICGYSAVIAGVDNQMLELRKRIEMM
jgi:putative GTP pyrophosphokinase